MQVQSISNFAFKKLFYGTNNAKMSQTQKDVLDDIEFKLEKENYVKKVENLGYDIYIEPSNNKFSIDVAFFKNLRYNKKGNLIYDKVINIGSFISDAGLRFKQIPYSCSIEQFENSFNNFFKNEAKGKYKRYVNYL